MNTLENVRACDGADEAEFFDTIEQIFYAETVETVWKLLTSAMTDAGFSRLIYGFTRFITPHSFGSAKDMLVLSNAEDAYVSEYVGQGHYLNGPMLRWAADNNGPRSWRFVTEALDAGALSEREIEVIKFNERHGVTAGITISFPNFDLRSRGALALIGNPGESQDDVDTRWAQSSRVLNAIAQVAHLRLTHLPYEGSRRPLTDRQREVLGWVGDGKTTRDIAAIMNLTPATVEKHLRLARRALDVSTTAQAVLKASFSNQIFKIPNADLGEE